MTPGKAAAQAGHAFCHTLLSCSPELLHAYHAGDLGTKVCLQARDLAHIQTLHERATALGLPNFLVTDHGHAAFRDGQPTVTALGVGPATREQVKHLLKSLPLLP